MQSTPDVYTSLEQRFAAWSFAQAAIQAVIIVGSRARSAHPADEWSDLDLVVFATDTALYLNDATWLDTFGQVRVASSQPFGQHDREWLALYNDGCKLDAAFLSIDPATTSTLQAMLDAFPYPTVLQRGVRILIDKTGSDSAVLRLPLSAAPHVPTQNEFMALINRMWLDAVKAAKFIRRADLWRAKQLCDGDLKQHLLTLLEWQAVVQPERRDIWYDGRFLDEWVDSETRQKLAATFAGYARVDLAHALLATLSLFGQLAQELTARIGLIYPLETDSFISQHIQSILSPKDQT